MLPIRLVAIFYTLMGALGWALAVHWVEIDPWRWVGADPDLVRAALVGVAVGLVTVVVSNLLERWAEWARRLSEAFREMLGELTLGSVFVIALFSAFGEELLFRGFLQQALATHAFSGDWADALGLIVSSVVFGLLHVGPDWETFWPWTVMALLMGGAFGLMFLQTGSLLAPILAHFTINFFNLILIAHERAAEES